MGKDEIPADALRLSKTKIFELIGSHACPFRYKLRYVDMIPEMENEFTAFADDGKAFHEAVQEFFGRENPEIETAEYDERLYLCKTKREWWESFIEKFVKGYLLENLKFKPYLVEKKIYDEVYNISAIADAIFFSKDGNELYLFDWKSGSMKSKEEIRTELAIYVFLFERSGVLPMKISKWGMFFPKERKIFVEEVDRRLVESVPSIIEEARKIVKEGRWEKNRDSCFFCNYWRQGVCENV